MVNEHRECPLVPNIEELISLMKTSHEKIDTLISLQRDVIRWLLIVVCIIALGRSAFDVGDIVLKRMLGADTARAEVSDARPR